MPHPSSVRLFSLLSLALLCGSPILHAEAKTTELRIQFLDTADLGKPGDKEPPAKASDGLEQRFLADTALPGMTLRDSHRHRVGLGGVNSVTHVDVQLNLEKLSPEQRSKTRVWIGLAAPKSLTTQGWLRVNFAQNGVGMSTEMNNRFEWGQEIILGCDYDDPKDTVALEITNLSSLPAVDCTLAVIVYTP